MVHRPLDCGATADRACHPTRRGVGLRPLGARQPVLDLFHPPDGARYPSARQRQRRMRVDRVSGQPVDRGQQCRSLTGRIELEPVALELVGRVVHVARGDRVLDRRNHQAVARIPNAGAAMQVTDHIGRHLLELLLQHLPEQMVVAKPDLVGVERDDEQVHALELAQHPLSVGALRDRVAQRSAQTLQDRCPHQKVPHGPRLGKHDLAPQVIDQEAVVGRKRVECTSSILVLFQ